MLLNFWMSEMTSVMQKWILCNTRQPKLLTSMLSLISGDPGSYSHPRFRGLIAGQCSSWPDCVHAQAGLQLHVSWLPMA